MTFKMHWDAIVDCNGHTEIHSGIHIVFADSKKEGIQHALDFLHNGAFVDWDAFLESDNYFVDLTTYE